MIRYVTGDEPYWIDSLLKKETERIECPQMNLMNSDGIDESVMRFLESYPVLSEKKAAIVTVADLVEADNPKLKGFSCPDFSTLIIRARSYDARKTFFKELKKKELITVCTKQGLSKKMEGFLSQKAGELGFRFTQDAFDEFLFRENYPDAEDVNCYSILEDLKSLAALSENGEVGIEAVKGLVEDHHRGNPFVVAAMIKEGNVRGLMEQAGNLSGQEIPALSALLREYRIAWKASLYKPGEMGGVRSSLCMKREDAAQGIRIITKALRALKSDSPKGCILASTYLQLAKESRKNNSPSTALHE